MNRDSQVHFLTRQLDEDFTDGMQISQSSMAPFRDDMELLSCVSKAIEAPIPSLTQQHCLGFRVEWGFPPTRL